MTPQSSQEALQQLRDFQSSRKSAQDIYRESQASAGVPTSQQRLVGLRGAVQNTENLLKGVDPSVSGRTQGSLVTEAQKQKLIALEREPIASQWTDQNKSLENESANYNTLMDQATKAAQLGLSDYDTREKSLSSLYSALYQREQDEIARKQREAEMALQQAQFQESIRQANEQFRLSQEELAKKYAYIGSMGNYFGNTTTPQTTTTDNRPSLNTVITAPPAGTAKVGATRPSSSNNKKSTGMTGFLKSLFGRFA